VGSSIVTSLENFDRPRTWGNGQMAEYRTPEKKLKRKGITQRVMQKKNIKGIQEEKKCSDYKEPRQKQIRKSEEKR